MVARALLLPDSTPVACDEDLYEFYRAVVGKMGCNSKGAQSWYGVHQANQAMLPVTRSPISRLPQHYQLATRRERGATFGCEPEA